jgi:hypothetical protein
LEDDGHLPLSFVVLLDFAAKNTQPAQPADSSTQVDSDQARWQKMVQSPFANISQQNQKPKQAGFSSASLRQELGSAMDEGRFLVLVRKDRLADQNKPIAGPVNKGCLWRGSRRSIPTRLVSTQ